MFVIRWMTQTVCDCSLLSNRSLYYLLGFQFPAKFLKVMFEVALKAKRCIVIEPVTVI